MKILRILTGTHAGTQARLTPGRYRIGKADDTDICITDWDDEEVSVELDEHGVISARRASASDPDRSIVRIPDFIAFPFGTTVLCFGNEDAAWPPDIELLAGMYHGSGTAPLEAGTLAPPRGTLHRVAALALVAVLLIAGGSVIASVLTARRATPLPAEPNALAALLQRQLDDAHLAGLHAHAQGHTVVVDGIVDESAQDVAARALIERAGYHDIARRYDVAHADAASIEESIGIDGVHVRYVGDGVFEIGGVSPSIARVEGALNRLRTDLNANVKRLDVDVTEAATASAVLYSAMLDVGGTRYVQTTDGVKHVFTAGGGEAPAGPRRLREAITPVRGEIH